jgi:hypothetical protein
VPLAALMHANTPAAASGLPDSAWEAVGELVIEGAAGLPQLAGRRLPSPLTGGQTAAAGSEDLNVLEDLSDV